ncbi:hypothetical protein I4200191B4_22090 [Pseudoflavonifractor gallinarum]
MTPWLRWTTSSPVSWDCKTHASYSAAGASSSPAAPAAFQAFCTNRCKTLMPGRFTRPVQYSDPGSPWPLVMGHDALAAVDDFVAGKLGL